MLKLYGFPLGGRNFAGGAISSPFERFSWWRVPSLETTKTGFTGKGLAGRGGAAGRGAAEFGAGGGAVAGVAARPVKVIGGGITGVAVSPPGQSQLEFLACGVDEEYEKCFRHKILPRSASMA